MTPLEYTADEMKDQKKIKLNNANSQEKNMQM